MTISKKDNTHLHQVLFMDMDTYFNWAPYFNEEFVKSHGETYGIIAGVMTTNLVRIDNAYKDDFFRWLVEKGVNVNPENI